MKIRVLFITHCANMGGGNFSMLQLMLELKKNYDVEPSVLVCDGKADLKIQDYCRKYGIPYIDAHFYWFKEKKGIKQYAHFFVNWLLYYPIIFYKLRNLHIDLVHSNGSVIDIGVWISRIKRVKHIWHLREYGDLDFGLYPVFGKKWERYLYKGGDRFIAISKSVEKAFSDVIQKDKIVLVYNGILPKSSNLCSTHTNSIIQFVMVGTVQPTKNQLEALQAFRLLKKWGYEADIHFIGYLNKDYSKLLKEYVSEHSLNENVIFWGERDDVPEILSKMDVGLTLSKSEAFGRVTVEYMLQGLGVIVTDTGANGEIVTDGVSGYIYSLGDYKGLAERMRLCIENRDKLLKISERGKKEALQRFVSTKNTEAIYKIYRQVLALN